MLRILREYVKKPKGSRSVSTWSPLAKAFNTSGLTEALSVNNLSRKTSGLFGVPELTTAEGFTELKSQAINDSDRLIEEAVGHGRTRKMVQIFDDLSDSLCRVADLAEFIRMAHPDQKYALAAEDTCLAVSGIVEKLNTHRELYTSLSKVVASGDIVPTSEIDNHVSKLFLFDFEQCGIHLPENLRRQVVRINDKILQVGQKFMAGAVTPRSVDCELLPEHIRQYFMKEGDNILVYGLFTDSANALAREAAYKIFLYPDERQESLLQELLNSRHQLAEICGFPTYAHRAIKGSTVETPEVVREFLDILNLELKTRAANDFDTMRDMKIKETGTQLPLMPWDTTYFTTKVKKTWLGTSNNEFTPYFSLGACMDGLNILTQSLYGVRLEPEPADAGEVWAPSVQKLAVVHESEGTLGHIYCDFFERAGKANQDCHFTIRGGRMLADGSYQNPVVVLMLSLPSPRWNNPCLLSPSALFAKHYQTQEPLPDDMIEKLCASKNVFPASELQVQVFYSMLDQTYHSNKIQGSTTKILEEIQNKYYGLPYVENTAWQLRFSHLVGYGAKYYSYLISRAVASWIWQTYFQKDPLSRSAGEKYRRECLAHGGGKPASKVVSDFLNKEASAGNFANALVNEIDEKDQHVQSIMALNK
ncbi:Similar to MIPEP: Mitochondrial intermediate peptidase (Homo sapiens) [Cotesia congregata]|uniref:Similar to MIPEP: Mitochondrial intermediate peptidase (Homo sapiens) n=1 Tax=Cotesia congregata TaxID=51543 RepID=A0A8J2MPU1_COTCN|nr:Similar to MIPEP: Mitochondrial intermediate peptidase (Homo sapiens) [Cotesia congregata]